MAGGLAERARAWHHEALAAVCDVLEPWAHGMVVRATQYPDYFDFNLVRVEGDPSMSVEALTAVADEKLAGLAHRRIDFELAEAAEPLRAGFEGRGWQTNRLVWMRHEVPPPPAPDISVEKVAYDAVHDLRVAWHHEDFPDQDLGSYLSGARDVALRRGAQVLTVRAAGEPVAFAQLERRDRSAEIAAVYVLPEHRGAGLGTAMTSAAISSAADARDLWIVADDEDRPKELYARLGFRPAWATAEFLRLP